MTAPNPQTTHAEEVARGHWNADRAALRIDAPDWPVPAWSRAPAWRRRPYITAAQLGLHPDQTEPSRRIITQPTGGNDG